MRLESSKEESNKAPWDYSSHLSYRLTLQRNAQTVESFWADASWTISLLKTKAHKAMSSMFAGEEEVVVIGFVMPIGGGVYHRHLVV